MTYSDLIYQWFYIATEERGEEERIDPFTRFIFLYISFIAFLSQNGNDTSDRAKINRLKEDPEAKLFYLSEIRDTTWNLKGIMEDLVKELRLQPIRNLTREHDTNWQGTDGVLRSVEDWKNLVEFWYRVRNNLFHGHKAPEFDRDRRLVSYAYMTLERLMRNFINHDLRWEFY